MLLTLDTINIEHDVIYDFSKVVNKSHCHEHSQIFLPFFDVGTGPETARKRDVKSGKEARQSGQKSHHGKIARQTK
jgi:hypothetical protein